MMVRIRKPFAVGNAQGLSLVEGLIAASVVAVAFLAISNLFPTGYANITYSGNQTLAQSYAQQKIEQLKNLSFNAIDGTTCSTTAENPDPANSWMGFSRTCTLTINVGVAGPLQGDMKKVKVTVTWPKQVRTGSLSVDTLFSR